jgi:dienelactone hydrolase
VLDFHGLGGTGSQQAGLSGWKAQCDSVGCIAVFPDSSKKAGDDSWNAGYCCANAEKDQIDDVQFARGMIKWLEANSCVDPKRVYATGGSNGDGMTYRLACDAADVIAAVAPVDFRCVTDPSNSLCQQYPSCPGNPTVILCTNPSAHHLGAYSSAAAKFTATAWNVFKTQSLPEAPPAGRCRRSG